MTTPTTTHENATPVAPHRSWRTLAADGASRGYDSRANAKAAARRVVRRIGKWCGIEHWSPQHPQDEMNMGWALVETVEPNGARCTTPGPLPADTLDAVAARLHREPIPFGVLVDRSGLDADTLRAALIQLEGQGRAGIKYGLGWHLV